MVAYTSRDLVNWEPQGAVFSNVDESYGGQNTVGLWAPEVLAHGGRYYLYYVNVMTGASDERVGDKDIVVVRSDDPLNFRGGDRRVLLNDDYAFIDPSPYADPETGELYLLFKRRGAFGTGTDIRIRPMRNPMNFSGSATILLQSENVPDSFQILEHPQLWHQGSVYFLLFSKGNGAGTTYQITYATSRSPMGPYTQRDTLFGSDTVAGGRRVISPGASSIVRDRDGLAWMVYRQKTTREHTFSNRAVSIDRVMIRPNTPTIFGTPTRGVDLPAPTPLR